jgi:hypothetical protein
MTATAAAASLSRQRKSDHVDQIRTDSTAAQRPSCADRRRGILYWRQGGHRLSIVRRQHITAATAAEFAAA